MSRQTNPDAQPRILFHVGRLPPPFRDIQLTAHPRGWEGERHKHDFWQFVFNRSGTGEVKVPRVVRVDAGRMVVMPPGASHIWWNGGDRPLELLNVHIAARRKGFDDLHRQLKSLAPGALAPPDPRIPRLVDRIAPEVEGGEAGYKYQVAALLMEMVVTTLRGIRRGDADSETSAACRRLEKALWYMESSYAEPLALGDIARILNVTPKHACELFRNELGVSPMRHLRAIRLEKARVYLEYTSLPVKNVAFAVGFRDEHYFSRLFRREAGCSPTAYRQRCGRAGG